MNRKAAYAFIICSMLSMAGGIVFMAWVLKRVYHFRELSKDHPGLKMFNASFINGQDPSNVIIIIISMFVVIGLLIALLISVRSGQRNIPSLLMLFVISVACFVAGLWYIHHIERRYFKHSMYLKMFLADSVPMILTGIWWCLSLFRRKPNEGLAQADTIQE